MPTLPSIFRLVTPNTYFLFGLIGTIPHQHPTNKWDILIVCAIYTEGLLKRKK